MYTQYDPALPCYRSCKQEPHSIYLSMADVLHSYMYSWLDYQEEGEVRRWGEGEIPTTMHGGSDQGIVLVYTLS